MYYFIRDIGGGRAKSKNKNLNKNFLKILEKKFQIFQVEKIKIKPAQTIF